MARCWAFHSEVLKIYYVICARVCGLHVCTLTMYVQCQKRMSGPLGPDLQVVVSYHMGPGEKELGFQGEQPMLIPTEPRLQTFAEQFLIRFHFSPFTFIL